MKLTDNQAEGKILIQDDYKLHHNLLLGIIILNLINAVINLSKAQLAYLEILDFIWVIIAVISITAMYIFLFKRSYTSEILKSEVDSVKLKKSFGTERILIKLKSGKIRPLYLKKTTNELEFLNEALGINNL